MGFSCRNFTGYEGLTTVFLGRRTVLGGTIDFQIEICLRTEPERDRVGRRQRRRIPMRPVADRLQRGLRGTGEAHNLRILQLRVIANQPEDGIWTILPPRQRRVAGATLAARLRQPHLRYRELQLALLLCFGRRDSLAGKRAGRDRSMSLDPRRYFTVRDPFPFQRM